MDPRMKLGKHLRRFNKGTDGLGSFTDRRGRVWAATVYFLVRAEMLDQVPPASSWGPAPKLLRACSDATAWPMYQAGEFVAHGFMEAPVREAWRIDEGPAREGFVWCDPHLRRMIDLAAATAWPGDTWSWESEGIVAPMHLRRGRDRMLVAVLMPTLERKPWTARPIT